MSEKVIRTDFSRYANGVIEASMDSHYRLGMGSATHTQTCVYHPQYPDNVFVIDKYDVHSFSMTHKITLEDEDNSSAKVINQEGAYTTAENLVSSLLPKIFVLEEPELQPPLLTPHV
jgi:hypothetical protein